jgi:iron complex outermembrane recepter protein
MNKFTGWSLLLGITALSVVPIGPVFAEEEINEIIVTARRMEERLQDVPISITVFNQQQIEARNVVNPQDLATYVPSLSANTNFGSENSSFAIRGFVQDIGTAPSVGVYFGDVVAPRGASNGLPAGDGAGPGSFFDLQNVQILKGPQGTLFGRNTTGGAVLLVPQKPTSEFGGYAEGSFGNFSMKRGQGVLNVPVNDNLRFRLGVDHQTREGYLNNTSGVGPRDFGDLNYTAVRASVVVDVTPDIENYTIGSYSYSNTHGQVQKLIAAGKFALGSFALGQLADQAAKGEGFYDMRQDLTDPMSKLTQWQIINTTTWHATDTLTVKNIASYARLDDKLNSAIFGTGFSSPPIPPLGLPAYRFDFTASEPYPGHSTAKESTTTEELQFQGRTPDDFVVWQAGGYLEYSHPEDLVGSQSPVLVSCSNLATLQCTDIFGFLTFLSLPPGTLPSAPLIGAVNITTGRTSFRDVGTYAQGTFKLTEQLKLTAGARYTWDREINDSFQQTVHFTQASPFAPGTIPFFTCTNPLATANGCNSHYEMRSHAPTWLIDLEYTPITDVLGYVKYTRGYRAGTIAPNVTSPYNIVRPEKVDTYELGAKTGFAGAVRGTFNAALFYNNFTDQQLQLGFDAAPGAGVSPTAAPINAGKSRIWGIELESSITPFTGFTFSASYTYLNTRIQELPPFPTPTGALYVIDGAQRVGDSLALSPKNKYTLNADYTLPLSDNIGKITLGATFAHTDSQISNYNDRNAKDQNGLPVAALVGLGTIPATNLLNLNLGWSSIAGKPVDVLFFVTNVTDKQYYTFIPGIGVGTGFETAQLGLPRMYGARIRVHFGQ